MWVRPLTEKVMVCDLFLVPTQYFLANTYSEETCVENFNALRIERWNSNVFVLKVA